MAVCECGCVCVCMWGGGGFICVCVMCVCYISMCVRVFLCTALPRLHISFKNKLKQQQVSLTPE